MKKFSLLSTLIFIFGFCICVSCGYLISNTVLSTFGYTTTISIPAQKYYALSMHAFDQNHDLSNEISILQAQNGAGFVFNTEQKSHLLSSIYENQNDAELVKNNLTSSGYNCEILEISLPSKNLDGNFSNDEKNVLTNAYKISHTLYKGLYDLSISLDTKVIDISKAKLECSNIYSSLIAAKTNLETFFKDPTQEIKKLKENLNYYQSYLADLTCENYASNNQTFSSLLKLTYCKILLFAY